MNLLTILGISGPWLAGCLALACIRKLQRQSAHPGRLFRLLGYGFFLGYALLYGLILANQAFAGQVQVLPVMIVLLALIMIGAGIMVSPARSGLPGAATRKIPTSAVQSAGGGWLKGILLAWIALHLVFALANVLSIPMFPWDSWLLWMYRAKAWFYHGGLAEITGPEQWITASGVPPYTVDAYSYPTFLSVIGFWVSLCLGRWSETLVNLPGILCGLAIACSLYGHALKLGLSSVIALCLCYLLVSTPLFATHMSLGGYSDLWMAGYAGLGFVALISGLETRKPSYTAIGLILLCVSALVKNEGFVWLIMGLALILLMRVPARIQLGVLTGLALTLVVSIIIGKTAFHVEGLGLLGFQDGSLHVPPFGSISLQPHNVTSAFVQNFLVLGNWNLLWLIIAFILVMYLRDPWTHTHRAVWSFLVLFLSTQVFIFGFTDQGAWAESYTAINRLPLQLLPAFIFCIALFLSRTASIGTVGYGLGQSLPTRVWRAPATALTLVIIGVVTSQGSPMQPTNSVLPELKFIMGTGSGNGGRFQVDSYQNGFALLSSGAVNIDAEQHPYLELSLLEISSKTPAASTAFFWRRDDQPNTVNRVNLREAGIMDLSSIDGWSGAIVEIGLLVQDAGETPVQLGPLSLSGPSLAKNLHLTIGAWLEFEPWSQRSINFIKGGGEQQRVSLPLVVAGWVILTLVLTRVPGLQARVPAVVLAGVVMLSGWMLLDLRWTVNGARQFAQSALTLSQTEASERASLLPEADIYLMLREFRDSRAENAPVRLIIVGNKFQYEYYAQRAKYHLLPDSAYVTEWLSDEFNPQTTNYVLFIDNFSAGDKTWNRIWNDLPVSDRWRDRLQLVQSSDMGILFAISQE